MISIRDIRKSYGTTVALDGFSFEARENEVVGIVGPNGAGKTTLFRVMVGLIGDYQGTVDLAGGPPSSALLARTGFLPEDPKFRDEYTVGELFRLHALSYGLDGRETDESRRSLIDLFDLGASWKKRLVSLSKGTKRRAFFMATLANLGRSRLLVLDEPFDGIDPEHRVRIRNFLKTIEGPTIVFSSHTLFDVAKLADRVVFIKNGKNHQEFENPSEVRLEDEFMRMVEAGRE